MGVGVGKSLIWAGAAEDRKLFITNTADSNMAAHFMFLMSRLVPEFCFAQDLKKEHRGGENRSLIIIRPAPFVLIKKNFGYSAIICSVRQSHYDESRLKWDENRRRAQFTL